MGGEKYGNRYWCVKVPKKISTSGEIYVFADEVKVSDGDLLFFRKGLTDINLGISKENWITFFAASCIDGHAVAVEHWEGEQCHCP